MADQVSRRYASSVEQREESSGLAVGFILFAGMLMLMVGIFQALAGVVGIVNDNFSVITRDYVFKFSTTTWRMSLTHLAARVRGSACAREGS